MITISGYAANPRLRRNPSPLRRDLPSRRLLFVGGVLFSLNFDFLGLDLDLLVLNVETEVVVDAHVLVGDPDDGEEGDKVSAPVGIE